MPEPSSSPATNRARRLFVSLAFAMSLVITCGLAAPEVRAALPPGSYDELRLSADEALIVKVKSMKARDDGGGWLAVTLKVRVLAIERSESSLEENTYITIQYRRRSPNSEPVMGPAPMPVLEEGGVYPAFLKKSEKSSAFIPAAYGESFTMTPES